jgi:hypothetical protein
MKLQTKSSEMERVARNAIAEQRSQIEAYHNELNQKNQFLRRLEDECSTLRIDAGQYKSKLESMSSELAELHGAMASLHGEMSALQRELEDSQKQASASRSLISTLKKTYEESSAEAGRLRREKDDNDKVRVALEQQLAETSASLKAITVESKGRIDTLVAEREALQASNSKKDLKLKQHTATNQELNAALGKVHHDMMTIKQDGAAKEEAMLAQQASLEKELGRLKDALGSAEEMNARHTRMLGEAQLENGNCLAELSTGRAKIESLSAEVRKLSKRLERVENEKSDLLIEISNKAQVNKELQSSLDALQEKCVLTAEQVEEEKRKVRDMDSVNQSKDYEIRQLQNQLSSLGDKIIGLERQLNEEVQLKENAVESSRVQQKENANRVVEMTQKLSKQTSDLASCTSELTLVTKKLEELSRSLQSVERERDDLVGRSTVMSTRLQELEDQYEEAQSKLDASEAELEEIKQNAKIAAEKYAASLHELQCEHELSLAAAHQAHHKHTEELEEANIQSKKQSESNLEKSLSRARETFQRQLEEIQAARQKEVSDARSRVTTLGAAMEGLQKELREESAKNAALSSEIEVLRELAESGGGEAEERLARSERERAADKHRLESLASDLKDQLSATNESNIQLQQQLAASKQETANERDFRSKAQLNLKRGEEKLRALEGSSESLRGEVAMLKKQVKEMERKFNTQLAAKDEEIQRVTRRNEVLSEAVTRMTQMGGTPVQTQGLGAGSYAFPSKGGDDISSSYAISYDQHQLDLERQDHSTSASRYNPSSSSAYSVPHDESDYSVLPAPSVAAPPLEPLSQTRYTIAPSSASRGLAHSASQHNSAKPTLRSNSATVRTPTSVSGEHQENSRERYRPSHHRSQPSRDSNENEDYAFPLQPATAHAPHIASMGAPVDNVSASLLRVQRAIESRRSNSTPRGGGSSRISSAPSSSFSQLDGDSTPARRGDGKSGARPQPPAHEAHSDKAARQPVINAEYDSSYAESVGAVYQREIFSPSRGKVTGSVVRNPPSPLHQNQRTHMNLEIDERPVPAEAMFSPAPSSTSKRKSTAIPSLESDMSGARALSSRHDLIDDGSATNRSVTSTNSKESTGSGSFASRIRDEVDQGKDSLLPYSPQKHIKPSSTPSQEGGGGGRQRADSAPRSSKRDGHSNGTGSSTRIGVGASVIGDVTPVRVKGETGRQSGKSASSVKKLDSGRVSHGDSNDRHTPPRKKTAKS